MHMLVLDVGSSNLLPPARTEARAIDRGAGGEVVGSVTVLCYRGKVFAPDLLGKVRPTFPKSCQGQDLPSKSLFSGTLFSLLGSQVVRGLA